MALPRVYNARLPLAWQSSTEDGPRRSSSLPAGARVLFNEHRPCQIGGRWVSIPKIGYLQGLLSGGSFWFFKQFRVCCRGFVKAWSSWKLMEFTTQKLKPFQRGTLEHCETDDIRQTFHGCRQTFHGCPPYKGKATCQELSRPIPMRIRGSTNAMRSCRLNQVIVIKLPSGYLT